MKQIAGVDELMDLLEQQGHRCALSGILLHAEASEIDHIIPIRDGGTHQVGNLHIVDSRIHSMRGTLPLDEFIDLCHRVAEHNPRRISEC